MRMNLGRLSCFTCKKSPIEYFNHEIGALKLGRGQRIRIICSCKLSVADAKQLTRTTESCSANILSVKNVLLQEVRFHEDLDVDRLL